MSFGKISDFDGEFECTFFPKVWGTLRNQLESGNVYAFRGKVDSSRESPTFLIDAIEDIKELESKAIQAIHITIDPNSFNDANINQLSDFLFDKSGNCSLYLHIDTGNNPYVVKINNQIRMNATDENLKQLRELTLVKNIWTE